MMSLVGGPRFFENNTIVECFNEWALGTARDEYEVEIYRDCEKVHGPPLFRSQYERLTKPRGFEEVLLNNGWHVHDDRHSDPFQDANEYSYMATQLSHLPRLSGYDRGNLLSYIPMYGNRKSMKDLIMEQNLFESFL